MIDVRRFLLHRFPPFPVYVNRSETSYRTFFSQLLRFPREITFLSFLTRKQCEAIETKHSNETIT